MDNDETMSESFKRELEAVSINSVLDPAYRKKKLILWTIRTTISIVLYIIFWKYNWVKWTLVVTIPLSLFSLFTIVISPYLLEKKIGKAKLKIEEVDKIIRKTPDE